MEFESKVIKFTPHIIMLTIVEERLNPLTAKLFNLKFHTLALLLLSLVLVRETTNMYITFLFNLLLSVILSVITMYINFILDVELS